MKKVNLYLIAIVIVLSLLAFAYFSLRNLAIGIFGADYIGDEALIELFNDNFEVFEATANELITINTGDKRFIIENSKSNGYRPNGQYIDFENHLMLSSNYDIVFTEKDYRIIDESKPWIIINDLDFESISFGENWVEFTNKVQFRNSIGILYYTGEIPYFVSPSDTIEQIKDNWYYYASDA